MKPKKIHPRRVVFCAYAISLIIHGVVFYRWWLEVSHFWVALALFGWASASFFFPQSPYYYFLCLLERFHGMEYQLKTCNGLFPFGESHCALLLFFGRIVCQLGFCGLVFILFLAFCVVGKDEF